ncbi:sn-glycerol-1-phosphate dehydrogenase [Poriferisphaera sp. WC338]|uniref:sn-glycerol-1-phosphate dehydrogenase n=1 Tax=Poriferisphaera sp. WC338 TaxID=3425129 RepID=UPI003D813D20
MTAQQDPTLQSALSHATHTHALILDHDALLSAPFMFAEQFPKRKAVLIADRTTFHIAGKQIADHLQQHNLLASPTLILDDPHLYAEQKHVDHLQQHLAAHDHIPIAVGAGTINDLTKLAAYNTNRPYMCVTTAASMDGYTAFGASITNHGTKQTYFCHAPQCVLADMDILCNAPSDMNASGYADLLAKIPAGADWILADALGIEPINKTAWNIIQHNLHHAVANAEGISNRNPKAIRALTIGLLMSGFAMQAHASSRPASGAEHQFSHLWDMQHHTHQGVSPSHGFKVGIGTIASTRLYETLLQLDIPSLNIGHITAHWPSLQTMQQAANQTFTLKPIIDLAHAELAAKYIPTQTLHRKLEHLQSCWPDLRLRLQDQLLPATEIANRLKHVAAPYTPQQIGIDDYRLRQSYHQARLIRRRFTVLDLAYMTGQFDLLVANVPIQ